MKKALVPLADGFEDIEAVSIIDVLRRGGVNVVTASLSDGRTVRAAHGIRMEADTQILDALGGEYDAIILPGGGEGTQNLSECEPLLERLRRQKADGGLVCAICAAPTVLEKAEVDLVSELDADFVRSLFLVPQPSAQTALDHAFEKLGPDARVLSMPYGGSTLPKVIKR